MKKSELLKTISHNQEATFSTIANGKLIVLSGRVACDDESYFYLFNLSDSGSNYNDFYFPGGEDEKEFLVVGRKVRIDICNKIKTFTYFDNLTIELEIISIKNSIDIDESVYVLSRYNQTKCAILKPLSGKIKLPINSSIFDNELNNKSEFDLDFTNLIEKDKETSTYEKTDGEVTK